MEEELNEHDLEERLYAMLHHVDETANNVTSNTDNGLHIVENAPRSTVRRYWRTSEPSLPYQKINTPKNATPTAATKPTQVIQTNQAAKPKEEKQESPVAPPVDLSIFQSPVPPNVKRTIEILDHENEDQMILDSSDEDEVIEVALPPKPTITIESSDEDEIHIVTPESPSKSQLKVNTSNKTSKTGERDISASPVPSVVSSVSDDFIRGDCIALNISSRQPDNPSFDFSLHGSDLLEQSTSQKKNKRKKNKEPAMSTPLATAATGKANDECFATPKSKARNKKQKNKPYAVTEKSLPNADVYDSDSNQSTDTNKNVNYKVSDTSLPYVDVYESDSNLSEIRVMTVQGNDVDSLDNSITTENPNQVTQQTSNKDSTMDDTFVTCIDLTDPDRSVRDKFDESDIQESIMMGNVSGFPEVDDYSDENVCENNVSRFASTKIPAILNEDLDFDNLKGKDKVCKRRRYSLSTLRAEMEKFYNESWGGENFNHREIQKSMSRDKSLWVIDPKDRMPSLAKKRVTCNYCNRVGHRDDTCHMKPPVCHMCGCVGHFEPRCPSKICVNCGSPNQMYSTMCRNCCNWNTITCAECGQKGHPATHCPDLWRRYHNTIDNNAPLEKCTQTKKHFQLQCSGCTRRGHLVHSCRVTLPFSGLPVNSPYVCVYRPIYPPTPQDNPRKQNKATDHDAVTNTPRNKRQSKSPTVHETHVNKKRNVSGSQDNERQRNKSPANVPQRKTSLSKDDDSRKDSNKNTSIEPKSQTNGPEKAPNFIPICSANHDKKGNMIQDNEVSDTSDVVTSSRIYVTNDIIDKFKTAEGLKWLKESSDENNVIVQNAGVNSFLSIKGKVADQESFQAKLRDWVKPTANKENISTNNELASTPEYTNEHLNWSVIPKNRDFLLHKLSKDLESLRGDLGDPNALYKELTYLQNQHKQLLKQKVISPQRLTNNRSNIKQMLKKLNMVLLGQAGLADGSQHLKELYSLQEKLTNSRQKIISNELRKEIGEHYVRIFTGAQRDDYSDLLKLYHVTNEPTRSLKKKKRARGMRQRAQRAQREPANSIPAQQTQNSNENPTPNEEFAGNNKQNTQAMTRNLVIFHKKLRKARPPNASMKKERFALARKLHTCITSLFGKETTTSKAMKKMRKIEKQARSFLANV